MHAHTERPYLMNTWYVAALSTEVGEEAFFHRTLLDTPVLIYRRQDGTPVALHDRCPHRFAPLHMGWREGDDVVCLYHALRFDCAGQCTHNPHGNRHIPKAAQVASYPLVERDGFLWIWMGDQAADYDAVPDYGELVSGHPNSVGYTYMPVQGNYELIMDNVMDLSHIDHVHGEIITTRGQLTPLIPKVEDTDAYVSARWEWRQTPAMLIFNQFLPEPEGEARHFFHITWTPPANIQLSVGATQDENAALDLDGCTGQYDLHTTTPETVDSTHYFFATRRNHREEDGEYNAQKIQAMHGAFEQEDVPIIEAVHQRMGTADFFELDPVLMSNDVAPVKVRKRLESLIRRERDREDEGGGQAGRVA
ncbi:Toluene-4-sulfonate monooxygenase system iron-sulfur subunit TsaM1 [wastewater metagenome]|uniref:Toluene-4-sulfonate monooxygenase system iron-sulfur subunit TsaM1 n=2 Tax=unclassified sequences TaxID=12908 RepID=A0A5B8RDH2_9ZZZZ|nr:MULTISPECIES: aromatic ring-hydroxylating dioxygenase subunit alpha [Arhodomonas]QEA07089.1 toluene-4-sulfonate monooxygenase system iron-sulfur subunit TsaM1 [uncultured organism]